VILGGAAETEHHEIAVYEGLITKAEAMGEQDIVGLAASYSTRSWCVSRAAARSTGLGEFRKSFLNQCCELTRGFGVQLNRLARFSWNLSL
jgi:hypothetical protein